MLLGEDNLRCGRTVHCDRLSSFDNQEPSDRPVNQSLAITPGTASKPMFATKHS